MNKGPHVSSGTAKDALPVDARELLHWFVNNFGLYVGSNRGLFISDWAEEREATLEAAIINLKSRGFSPCAVTGETIYRQADYLWKESRSHSQFGRPLASKLEIELLGSDVVIVDNLEAPENSRHLWYLYNHLLYPRAIAGKATIITTPLSWQEFIRYGDACPDLDFCGKPINWEKLVWLLEASAISLDTFKLMRDEGLPPMLKAEYFLYKAMKDRNINAVGQHVLGDYMLDFALIEKEHRLCIDVDTIGALAGSEVERQESKRNLVLLADGWQIVKFSTGEILANKNGCVDAIDEVWRTGRKKIGIGRLVTGTSMPALPELPVHDDVQMAAITFGGGPAAIIGGAGVGKTTCIVQRVAYLLARGIAPESILVLTHSNDTQRSLKRAIEPIADKQQFQKLSICSWQDFGSRILKENLPAIKRKPPLKVESNPLKIIQRLLNKAKKELDPAKLELSGDIDEFYIAAVISMYKSHLISPLRAKEEASSYSEEIIAKIYQQLEDQLLKANRIDRDDVIMMAVQVLLENDEVRQRFQRQFEFVLVDEYQDSTVAQEMLARLVAAPQDNLFIAGDEDETVAESKNACPELLVELSLRMPQARCFILERNWRSHPEIVDHARQLISTLAKHRINRDYHSAWGQAPASAVIGPAVLNNEHEEAEWVADEIVLLADSGRSFGDIGIIYRHHVYATILEEALDRKGVRYQSSNPITNFIPDEVEDMLAFLKLVIDPDGPRARESFERVCSLRSKEIDPKLSGTIASFAEANNLSYLKAVEIYSEATADSSCRELEQLVRVIRTMHQEKLPPAETIALIRRTQRLNEYYKSVKIPPGLNYEPCKKLTQLEEDARSFKATADFIKHVSGTKTSGTGVDNGVQVLQLLDCKGLEFPIVFMVGMAEGIFPADTAIDLQEEKRICYVGFTRAKELLYISYPLMFSGVVLQPSRFLIDARLMAASAQPHVQPTQIPQQTFIPPAAIAPATAVQQMPQAPVQPPTPTLPAQAPPPQTIQPAALQPAAPPVVQPPVAQPPLPAPVATPMAATPVQPIPAPIPQQAPPPMPVQPAVVQAPPVQPPAVQPPPRPPSTVPASPPAPAAPVARPANPVQLPVPPNPVPPQLPPVAPAAKSEPRPGRAAQPTPAPAPQPATPAVPVLDHPAPRAVPPLPATAPQAPAASAQPMQPQAPAAPQRPVEPSGDPFRIHTTEQTPVRGPMPGLPKSKRDVPADAPVEVPGQPQVVPQPVAHQLPQVSLPPPAVPVQQPHVSLPVPSIPVHMQPPAPSVPQHPVVAPMPPQQPVAPSVPPAAQTPAPQPAADPFNWGDQSVHIAQDAFSFPTAAPPTDHQLDSVFAYNDLDQHAYQQPVEPRFEHTEPGQLYSPAAPMEAPVVPSEQQYEFQQQYVQPVHHAPVDYHQPFPHQIEPHAVPEAHPSCPSCTMPLEANARFCGECGYTLQQRIPACPTCGCPLESSAKFCGECGTSLNAPIASDDSHLTGNVSRMQELKDKQQGWVNKVFKMLES